MRRMLAGITGLFAGRLRYMPQLSASECGAACLAMLLNHIGLKVSVTEVSRRCRVGRHGVSAATIIEVAQQFGVTLKAFAADLPDLQRLSTPAILHWGFNHWIIQERWGARGVTVVDPAVGRHQVPHAEVEQKFTGVALLLVDVSEPPDDLPGRIGSGCFYGFVRKAVRSANVVRLVAVTLGFAMLAQCFGLTLAYTSKIIIDFALPRGMPGILRIAGIAVLAIGVSIGLSECTRSLLLVTIRARLDYRLMTSLVRRLLDLPLHFFQSRSSGDLLNRLGSYAILRQTLTDQFIRAALDIIFLTGYLAAIAMLDMRMFALTLVIGIMQATVAVARYLRTGALVRAELVADGEQQSALVEALQGMTHIKALGKETAIFERWDGLFSRRLNTTTLRARKTATMDALASALQSSTPFVLMWMGAVEIITGKLSLGSMFTAIFLASSALQPLLSLLNNLQSFQYVLAYADRLDDILESTPETSGTVAVSQSGLSATDIRFEGVTFYYPGENRPAIDDVSFTLPGRLTTAIVGPTGAGKTTLILLLLSLYRPARGRILYGETSLEEVDLSALRSHIGAVLQDDALFSGSIWENLTLGVPNATIREVIDAASAAQIHEDIISLPAGYETYIAEGGRNLSGGQRQRLSLARALVRHPSILILDEATSQLDVRTEVAIARALDSFVCTRVVIAHRLSTAARADRILVLDQGRVVEYGQHYELLGRGGLYASLWDAARSHEGTSPGEEKWGSSPQYSSVGAAERIDKVST